MASKRFREVHKLTAQFEGGWSNHSADPGGKTMYGVTEAVFHSWLRKKGKPIRPVRSITLDEAHEIYYADYWLASGAHKLARGVDRMVYDAAVNSGVGRSKGWLKRAVGDDDPAKTVQKLYEIRMKFLRGLGTWRHFGKGWTRRVKAMRDTALAEAGKKPVPDVSDVLTANIQADLNAKGFGPLAVDGIPGPRFQEAINRFKKAAGYKPLDGILSELQYASLKAWKPAQRVSADPAPIPAAPAKPSPLPPPVNPSPVPVGEGRKAPGAVATILGIIAAFMAAGWAGFLNWLCALPLISSVCGG